MKSEGFIQCIKIVKQTCFAFLIFVSTLIVFIILIYKIQMENIIQLLAYVEVEMECY